MQSAAEDARRHKSPPESARAGRARRQSACPSGLGPESGALHMGAAHSTRIRWTVASASQQSCLSCKSCLPYLRTTHEGRAAGAEHHAGRRPRRIISRSSTTIRPISQCPSCVDPPDAPRGRRPRPGGSDGPAEGLLGEHVDPRTDPARQYQIGERVEIHKCARLMSTSTAPRGSGPTARGRGGRGSRSSAPPGRTGPARCPAVRRAAGAYTRLAEHRVGQPGVVRAGRHAERRQRQERPPERPEPHQADRLVIEQKLLSFPAIW